MKSLAQLLENHLSRSVSSSCLGNIFFPHVFFGGGGDSCNGSQATLQPRRMGLPVSSLTIEWLLLHDGFLPTFIPMVVELMNVL